MADRTETIAGEQTCRTCGQTKPVSEFTTRTDTGRRRTDCRSCGAGRSSRWAADNPGARATHSRRWRAANPERDASIRLAAKCRAYGITPDRYHEMLSAQGGGCALCGKTPEQNRRMLAVDHDHRCCPDQLRSCGQCVRGLLCSPCNFRLGVVEDEDFLSRALAYLQQNPTGRP